jgi:hypothetical protein
MADYHRIHPVTVGSPPPPPPPPSAPPEQARGKKPSHDQLQLQLPVTAPAPLPPPPRRRRHSRCCRCVCRTLLAVLALVVALGATAGVLYLVFRPKIPNFRVDRLTVTRFDVNTTTMTVTDAFDVDVTATNPNKRIGIYYGGGGEVTASFNGTQLCRGGFPALYQGHRTTVRPRVSLAGETRLDSAVAGQLLQQQQAGFVPLTVRARVPIRIKFGAVKLWKMTGKANCNLVVDNIQAGTQLRIRSNSCSFKLKI